MPFLVHYAEMKILNGLGYRQDINELDANIGACLIAIKGELNKLDAEEMDKKTSKGRTR